MHVLQHLCGIKPQTCTQSNPLTLYSKTELTSNKWGKASCLRWPRWCLVSIIHHCSCLTYPLVLSSPCSVAICFEAEWQNGGTARNLGESLPHFHFAQILCSGLAMPFFFKTEEGQTGKLGACPQYCGSGHESSDPVSIGWMGRESLLLSLCFQWCQWVDEDYHHCLSSSTSQLKQRRRWAAGCLCTPTAMEVAEFFAALQKFAISTWAKPVWGS